MTRFRDRRCVRLTVKMFLEADTSTVRLLTAQASFIYAVLMVWPDVLNSVRHYMGWMGPDHPSVFGRPAYALMAICPGGVWSWVVLFLAHWAGVHWRTYSESKNVPMALFINGLGLAVWAFSTLSLSISLGTLLPTSALEVVIVFFSFWVLVRTDLFPEIVTP